MLVVADVSPFIALTQLSGLEILPALFEEVIIPPEVLAALGAANRPPNIRSLAQALPKLMRAPSTHEHIPGLHAGETAAIQLAYELDADILLIDEIKGRKAAIQRGLQVTGTVGTLEMAAQAGMLNLRDAFTQLKQTNFLVSQKLLNEVLFRHEKNRQK